MKCPQISVSVSHGLKKVDLSGTLSWLQPSVTQQYVHVAVTVARVGSESTHRGLSDVPSHQSLIHRSRLEHLEMNSEHFLKSPMQ